MGDKMKTAVAAAKHQISVGQLLALIRHQRITPPERDCSGHYWWGPTDIEAAKEAMKRDRRRKEFRLAQPA